MAASPTADIGQGVTLTLQNGTTTTNIFTAKILGFTPPSVTREVVEVSDVNATAVTKVHGRQIKCGPMKLKIAFNPDTAPNTLVSATAGTCTMTFPSAATWAGTAGITAYEPSDMNADSLMEADVTLEYTGLVTVTPAS